MSDVATIRRCYTGWFDAIMAGDTTAVAALLAEDFRYVDIYGQVLDASRYFGLSPGLFNRE